MTVFSFVTFFPLSITQTLRHSLIVSVYFPYLLLFYIFISLSLSPSSLFMIRRIIILQVWLSFFCILYFNMLDFSYLSHAHTHKPLHLFSLPILCSSYNLPSCVSSFLSHTPSLTFSLILSLLLYTTLCFSFLVHPSPPLPSQLSLTLSTLIHSLLPGATR